MKPGWLLVLASLAALATTACPNSCRRRPAEREIHEVMPAAAAEALDRAEAFELYSLAPSRKAMPENQFRGWLVLGHTSIQDASTRKKLADAIKAGVADSVGTEAGCFRPAHGIRVTRAGKSTEFVLGIDCLQVYAHYPDGREEKILTTRSPLAVFDDVLRAAHIPLAPKQQE